MKKLTSTLQHGAMLFALSAFACGGAFAQANPALNDAEIAHIGVTANQIDVNYGNIALKNSTNPEVKRFAQTMIDDHSGVIKAATALAQRLGVTPQDNAMSKSLNAGAVTETKKLESLKGAAFDKAYVNNEVEYHKAVITAVHTLLIPQIQNADVKDLFVSISPVLDTHLEHAYMLQKKLNSK